MYAKYHVCGECNSPFYNPGQNFCASCGSEEGYEDLVGRRHNQAFKDEVWDDYFYKDGSKFSTEKRHVMPY